MKPSSKSSKKSFLKLVSAAVLLSLSATTIVSIADDKKKPESGGGKPALTVTTTMPQSGELALNLAANGNVTAWQETIIGAEVSGMRLIDVRVNVGDVVKRGQLLASFAPETIAAELAQQKATVAEAEAALAEAQTNADRARSLEQSGAMSAQQINQYTTAAKTAEARAAAARAMITNAQIKFRNTRVLAPDSGVISSRGATVGAVAQPGQELFRMIRNNRLEWRAEVSAADLPRVKIGQPVVLTIPGSEPVTGKVRIVAPTIDAQTRNTIVYVDLPIGSSARAGMFTKGEFSIGSSNGLTVPQQAVVVRDGYSYVFALKQNQGERSNVTQQKIITGRRSGDRLEVVDGLKADQRIVASGAGFLNDGDLVDVAAAAKASAASAPATKAETAKTATVPGVATEKKK